MAVYTQVEKIEVQVFIRGLGHQIDLGEYVAHEGITQGVENTNYHLHTTTGRYILTIFEKRIDPASLPFVFGFTDHLKARGLPVPKTLGQGIIASKPAAVTEYLTGADIPRPDITPHHCEQVGRAMAHMHLAVRDFTMTRANPVGFETWKRLIAEVGDAAPVKLVNKIMSNFANCGLSMLPRGGVHADLCQDNVFFENDKFSGFIDFYFSCTDAFVYDLAVAVNSWCFDMDNKVNAARLNAFIVGYESVRPITKQERAAWEPVRKAAALRMFSTRLYDWVNTPPSANVKKHDPSEYLAKMECECPLP